MLGKLLFLAAVLAAVSGSTYKETGDCEEVACYANLLTNMLLFLQEHENLYKYFAEEDYFGDEIKQTVTITVFFKVRCESGVTNILSLFSLCKMLCFIYYTVGTHGEKKAKKYSLHISKFERGGSVIEAEEKDPEAPTTQTKEQEELKRSLSSGFFFVQTEDGSIPTTFYSREEDKEVVNIKKAIVSAFQANFEGTKEKEEADPQSLHKAKYR